MNPNFYRFREQVMQPLRFRLFMLQRLPSAFFAGLRIEQFDECKALVTVKHKWFNQNPFGSMYFAVQSMAAEMSTGLPGFAQVYRRNPPVSMLVVRVEGLFFKKVTGRVVFTCSDGEKVIKAVEDTLNSKEGVAVTCLSVGRNEAGEIVSEFMVTWSFKTKPVR